MPNCYVIAGANGAGKTTFAREFLPKYVDCLNFINPDLIASGLSPFDPARAMTKAGRLVLREISSTISAGSDFGFETTLSGRSYLNIFRKMLECEYAIHAFYLWIPSPELALARIHERVQGGGHDVPEADVRRRFDRTFKNLQNLYLPIFSSLNIFDSAPKEPELVCKIQSETIHVINREKYSLLFGATNE